jgi:ribosomal-protein-alanine N-acetyltransferase
MDVEMKESNINIRHMTKLDVPRVCEIENSIFSLPWSEKSFIDACENPNNVYLVCEYDGTIAGYCGMWTVLGEGNITNVAVDADYRKKGIAGEMLAALHESGAEKNVDAYFLEVRESNAAAIHLYEKMGYKEIGRRKRFYERPVEDAIVMAHGANLK